MKLSALLLFLTSCSTFHQESEIAAWKNRSIHETATHPYFKNLEVSKREGMWTYRDNTAGNGQGHCATLGGCRSMAMLYCGYHFVIKDKKIVELNHSGVCPMSKKILAPKKS